MQVLTGEVRLRPSENDYDWLGHGIYFWENNLRRALDFAQYRTDHPGEGKAIQEPCVLGAVIGLGHCLDLLETGSLNLVKTAYEVFAETVEDAQVELPRNTMGPDLRLRKLDCAVMEFLHHSQDRDVDLRYDSVRGVFTEGNELYPGAGFHEKDPIQICVRNPNCIKGYFLPLDTDEGHKKV